MDVLNIILLSFIAAVFWGGFWCGKTYGTLGAMFTDLKAHIKAWWA